MASRDVDRQVASYARRSWTDCIRIPTPISPDVGVETESAEESTSTKLTLEGETLSGLLSFVQRAVMDPAGLYLYLNPVQVAVAPTVHHGSSRATRGKVSLPPRREELEGHAAKIVDPEEESDTDRRARLRIGGLGVLQYLIGMARILLSLMRTLTELPMTQRHVYFLNILLRSLLQQSCGPHCIMGHHVHTQTSQTVVVSDTSSQRSEPWRGPHSHPYCL